jgi:hypothetical protein
MVFWNKYGILIQTEKLGEKLQSKDKGDFLMRRIISLLFIITLIFTVIPATTAVAAIKLNETKLTLDEGSHYQLELTGSSKAIKWTSSNSKIVKVSTTGKLTAIKVGNAIITAKVSSKKYKCYVTVKDALTEDEAAKHITYESTDTAQGLVLIFNNENQENVKLDATVTYYDAKNAVLKKKNKRILVFQSERKSVLTFSYPDGYDHYKIDFSVDLSSDFNFPSQLDNILLDINKSDSTVTANLTNNTKFTCCIPMTALFYKNGIIVGYDDKEDLIINAGAKCTIEFSNQHDSVGKIDYDNYEVILNEAFAG